MSTIINKTTEIFEGNEINSNYGEHILNIYYCSQNGHTDYAEHGMSYWSSYNTTIKSHLASDNISDADLYEWFKSCDEEVGCSVCEGYEGLFVLIDDEGYPHICDCEHGVLNVQDYDEEICSKLEWDCYIEQEIEFNNMDE